MNETIKKDLNDALQMLCMITLSGDAVDVMAAAKSKIRRVVATLDKEVSADG